MVLRRAVVLSMVGVGAGTVAALGTTRVLRKLLFEVAPTDYVTFISVAVIVVLVAVLASALPARRAAGVQPLVALRQD